jgi:hypothetical protein
VQQLSHYTWNITQKKATISEVYRALNELISANMPLYQKEMEILSGTCKEQKAFANQLPAFNFNRFSGNIPVMKFMIGGKVKFITLFVGI